MGTKRKPSSPEVKKQTPQRLRGIVAGDGDESRPVWRLTLLDQDHDGAWSWKINEVTLQKIVTLLTDMERLTWREIWAQQTGGKRRRGQKHKFIPIESLCGEAKYRLDELGLTEWGELFRFRTGNMERLWGLLSEEAPRVFYPIWWDPEHEVCPSADQN